jgi:DNA-directed RNA polymerase-3 subunit RPC5
LTAGQLHLHPINETHQLRPTLTYLDVFSRKTKRRGTGADSDSDDGPPPDPDEPPPPPVAPKKDKKPAEVKEVQVAARRAGPGDKGPGAMQGGLSAARSEMLMILRAEEDESWVDLDWYDGEVRARCLLTEVGVDRLQTAESAEMFESIFSTKDDELDCKTDLRTFVTDIAGL